MQNKWLTHVFMMLFLCVSNLSAQDHSDYLERAKQRLREGDCDKAQKNYDLWKEFTKKIDYSIERSIAECEKKGSISFWTSDSKIGNIEITLVGEGTKILSSYYSNGKPEHCGDERTVTFSNLKYGEYYYTINGNQKEKIKVEGCVLIHLTFNSQTQGNSKTNIQIYRNGQKPTSLLVLSHIPHEKFYIFYDGVIMCCDENTKKPFEIGRKQSPIYKNWNGRVWAWTFYRNIGNNRVETYTVSTNGEVWAKTTDGVFFKCGYETQVDF